jgi:type III secretory pathway component EscU
MFTNLFLLTTNPKLTLNEFASFPVLKQVLISVIFHTILYASLFNLINFIFCGKILSNIVNSRLIGCLLTIMFFGYFARFLHVKEIYKTYNENMEKTRSHLDKLYITWIFIG